MRVARILLALAIVGVSRPMALQAYEWNAHNGLSDAARVLATQAASDTRLEAFLSQNQGTSADGEVLYDLTTRAGDPVWDEIGSRPNDHDDLSWRGSRFSRWYMISSSSS